MVVRRLCVEIWSGLSPNALEFSCGASFHYSIKLLGDPVSYNSSLARCYGGFHWCSGHLPEPLGTTGEEQGYGGRASAQYDEEREHWQWRDCQPRKGEPTDSTPESDT